MDTRTTLALVIFIVTYTGIIFTRLPKMNIDRPGAAFFGAVAMMLTGVLTFDEAFAAIDFNTIALLLGMMIIISTLEIDGFFSLIASKTLSLAHTPLKLLILITLITGISSAFLVNDAVVLLFTPVVIVICRTLKLHPVPYLVAEILASNTGSAMAVTGNPQNMLIGINSGIPYGHFLLHLLPVSVIGMALIVGIVYAFYRRDLRSGNPAVAGTQADSNPPEEENGIPPYDFTSMRTSVPVFGLVVVLFFFSHILSLSIPVIALAGASLIILLGRIKPSRIIRQVDWVLILFFACLFIVVKGVEKAGLMQYIVEGVSLKANASGLAGIHLVSLLGSQVVSNVPFTVVMLPFIKTANSDILWLALASASTLAGNATVIGAMANLIVIESAESRGIKIRFFEFMKVGLAVTIPSLLISFLVLRLYLG